MTKNKKVFTEWQREQTQKNYIVNAEIALTEEQAECYFEIALRLNY